jgi:AcrR family transcriptional regulator
VSVPRPPFAGKEEARILGELPDSPRLRRVLDELEIVMHTQGFLHLSMDELARVLRCSKGTLYRLAESREDLFDLALRLWCARVRDEGWNAADATERWAGRFEGYCRSSVTAMRRCNTSTAFWQDVKRSPRGRAILTEHQKLRIDGLEALVRMGAESNSVRDVNPRLLAELMLRCMALMVDPDFTGSVSMRVEDAVDEWYRIIEFGILAPTLQPPGPRRDAATVEGNGSDGRASAEALTAGGRSSLGTEGST